MQNYLSSFINISGDFRYSSSGITSSQRPDVVPGNTTESEAVFHEHTATELSSSEIDKEKSSISAQNQGLNIVT